MRSAALHTREKHAALSGQYSGIKTSLWNAASAKGAVQISRRRRGSQSTKHFWGHAAAPRKRQSAEVAAATRVADIPFCRVRGTAVFIQRQGVLTDKRARALGTNQKNRALTFAILASETNFHSFSPVVCILRETDKKKKKADEKEWRCSEMLF